MQLRFYLLTLLFLISSLHANNLEKVVQAIQSQDIVQMTHVFDNLEPMTLSEARNFLDQLYHQFNQDPHPKKKNPVPFFRICTLGHAVLTLQQ